MDAIEAAEVIGQMHGITLEELTDFRMGAGGKAGCGRGDLVPRFAERIIKRPHRAQVIGGGNEVGRKVHPGDGVRIFAQFKAGSAHGTTEIKRTLACPAREVGNGSYWKPDRLLRPKPPRHELLLGAIVHK